MPPIRTLRIFLAALLFLGIAGAVTAQLEVGDRGIPPLDSSSTLEITGIKVDVSAKDSESARFAGWRMAQRLGFKALWAKMHNLPLNQAPNLPDSTLDTLVSSIIVQNEQIGPTRYIATLGILFDRARAGQMLGVAGQVHRSAPLLLIPITISGGTPTSVETRNAWQRAWAEFRTSQSPIDYVRVSGLGIDPLLINAAQTRRPGRDWWRNIIDLYGAADVLMAEVDLHRAYPGGPASATFVAFKGPDREPIGTFTLTATNSAGIQEMMNKGVEQMDALFARALAAGMLRPDPSLLVPEPPAPPEEPSAEKAAAPVPVRTIQVLTPFADPYALAALRSLPGVVEVINAGSILLVSYHGDINGLRNAVARLGWVAQIDGTNLRMSRPAVQPAPAPAPPQPAPGGASE